MSALQRIQEIEAEIARTQKNKATEYHLGLLKARLAKLKAEVRTISLYVSLYAMCQRLFHITLL